MCDEGIGGYRSAGKGCFEQPRLEDVVIAVPEKPDGWLSLSLFHPTGTELDGLGDGFYDLLTRSGYVYSPDNRSLRRKTVRMFDEGSVFPTPERRGELVDVTPDFNINVDLIEAALTPRTRGLLPVHRKNLPR